MIAEYTYSQQDLKRRCYGCDWLKLKDDNWYGKCECEANNIKYRNREITSRACICKKTNKQKEA